MSGSRIPQRIVPYSPFVGRTNENVTLPWVDVTDYGAASGGIVDCTAAFQAALDVSGAHVVFVPVGTYLITGELVSSQHGTVVIGCGPRATILVFSPASGGKAAIHFTTGINAVLFDPAAIGLRIISGDTSFQKFGVRATDTSRLLLKDVWITTGTGASPVFTGGSPVLGAFSGGGSAGIRLNGREATTILRCKSYADIPLWIDDNPNFTIDSDHLSVHDFYGVSDTGSGTNPVVYITSGVNLTHNLFDGYQIWAGGGRALYHVDTTTTFSSNHLRIENVRYEQTNGTSAEFAFQIERNQPLYNVTFKNVQVQGPVSGYKLRNVPNPVWRDTDIVASTGVSLDVDSTASTVELDSFDAASNMTKSMGTLVLLDSRDRLNSLSPHSRRELWVNPAGSNFAAGKAIFSMGVWVARYQGSLTTGNTFLIPTLGGAVAQGRFRITYKGATKFGSFTVYVDGAQAFMESTTDTARGTTETNIGPLAGRISINHAAASDVRLHNQLGETITYDITTEQI